VAGTRVSVPPVLVLRDVVYRANAALSSRLDCVDVLRGIVMVLMALDHTRDFFTNRSFAPEYLAQTTGPLFFTRLITHFCAPVFFLLAGVGGYLSFSRGKSIDQVSKFFWTRGLWLVFLDLAVMSYAWTYTYPFFIAGVLWALGCSMVVMAFLVRLPLRWVATIGALIIVTHNLFDWVDPAAQQKFGPLWLILHGHGIIWIEPGNIPFFVLFSLIPWVGVMAVGYALGAVLCRDGWETQVWRIGVALTVAFLLLRGFHLYGNGHKYMQTWAPDAAGRWKIRATLTLTIISFFNTLKYPASLQFLLMTLGPSLIALAWLSGINARRGIARIFLVFGRVPLFYYVIHIFFIHTLAVWTALALHQPTAWLLYGGPMLHLPPIRYGHGLPFIYAMWLVTIALLYLPCRWFMNLKQQRTDLWWLRYL
jgi:uncharacterized membrane protein